MVHRILKETIKGGGVMNQDKRAEYLRDFVERAAMQSNRTGERAADEAEREVEDMKKVEYMADKVGEEFEGIVSGVTRLWTVRGALLTGLRAWSGSAIWTTIFIILMKKAKYADGGQDQENLTR